MSEVDNLIERYLLDDEVAVFMQENEALLITRDKQLAAKDAEIKELQHQNTLLSQGNDQNAIEWQGRLMEKDKEIERLKTELSTKGDYGLTKERDELKERVSCYDRPCTDCFHFKSAVGSEELKLSQRWRKKYHCEQDKKGDSNV